MMVSINWSDSSKHSSHEKLSPRLDEHSHGWLYAQLKKWSAATAIARERKALLKLTQRELSDIGITRAQAEAEAKRDFLDIPGNRLTHYGLLDCGAPSDKSRMLK